MGQEAGHREAGHLEAGHREAGHFDICGPLPGPGVTILEASAGTGKTFTIAALVARLVAEEEVPLSGDPGGHVHPDGYR